MRHNRTFSSQSEQVREFIQRHSRGASPSHALLLNRTPSPHPSPPVRERGPEGRVRVPLQEFRGTLREVHRGSEESETQFNSLALDLFGLQYAHNPAYRRLCQARKILPLDVAHWTDIPSVPSVAFKELQMTSLCLEERTAEFHSSGTTDQKPSRHFHDAASLALYEASLLGGFGRHVLTGRWPMIFLTPSGAASPHSSLVHMFETVRRECGSSASYFVGRHDERGGWTLDGDKVQVHLRGAVEVRQPVTLLGTAFGFVHLLDHLAAAQATYLLPAGSRVMETGGYKGRSRTMSKAELHALITHYLGVPASHIVCEYGMSELSSQAYDHSAGTTRNAERGTRTFRFPPWARVQVISPETGLEVAEGETGLIRVFDLANVRSVLAIQTEDLGVRHGDGFELLGRATQAEPRGCSLMSV
jgi:hypothetical protein